MPRKPRTMPTKKKINPVRPTLVTFLLDRTGSMNRIKQQTIDGFNGYLDRLQREAGDLVEFTLIQFDSTSIDTLYHGVSLTKVQRRDTENFVPRDSTPLIDACVKAIRATETREAARLAENPRVVVVIQTDGQENCSREFCNVDLVNLIAEKRNCGWDFLYLGADIDAYAQAAKFGIGVGSTVSYQGRHSMRALDIAAQNTALYAQGIATSTAYSTQQKKMSGDTFDPNLASRSNADQIQSNSTPNNPP